MCHKRIKISFVNLPHLPDKMHQWNLREQLNTFHKSALATETLFISAIYSPFIFIFYIYSHVKRLFKTLFGPFLIPFGSFALSN